MLKRVKHPQNIIFLFVFTFFLHACSDSDDNDFASNNTNSEFGSFSISEDTAKIHLNGEISSRSLTDFNNLVSLYPNVRQINIINSDGSSDDETNFLLMKQVHDLNFNTHLEDNAEIASGAVDFFLAGHQRSRGTNIRVGVHSWSEGNVEANQFPVGHANHTPYIDSYLSVGMTQTEANAFYYFTINAASANDIHWMSEQEFSTYNLFTQ